MTSDLGDEVIALFYHGEMIIKSSISWDYLPYNYMVMYIYNIHLEVEPHFQIGKYYGSLWD